jgi:uncharacterized membrane protein
MNTQSLSTPKPKKKRAWELDFLRGIAIIMVIYDHVMLTLGTFYYTWLETGNQKLIDLAAKGAEYWTSDIRIFWRPFFIFIFFFVSGLCTALSRNNLKRGFKLAIVALLVSAGTFVLENYIVQEEGMFIMFGVLHCMAVIILIYALISGIVRLLAKNNKYILSAVCLAIGIAAIILDKRYNLSLAQVTLSSAPYVETSHQWLGLFVYVESWWSADYFPILPFVGYFLLGASIAPFVYPKRKSLLPALDGKWHLPVTVAGRFSLLIYLLSQILAYLACYIITYAVTGEFVI